MAVVFRNHFSINCDLKVGLVRLTGPDLRVPQEGVIVLYVSSSCKYGNYLCRLLLYSIVSHLTYGIVHVLCLSLQIKLNSLPKREQQTDLCKQNMCRFLEGKNCMCKNYLSLLRTLRVSERNIILSLIQVIRAHNTFTSVL
jgi:hypothetical protein